MLACKIHTSGSRCLIFSVFYRSPNADEVFLADGFRTFLHKFNDIGISDLIITGDFNFPHIDWSTISPTYLNTQVESFCDILNDFFLIQMNGFVTRPSSTTGNHSNESILDLVLTNHEALIDNVTIRPGGFDSDHIPVTFTIKSSFNRLKNVSRKVYSYRKVDFNGLRATLSCIPWDACFSANDVNSSVESFQDLLLAAVNQHVPQTKLRRHSRPPWIDDDVMKLVRKKKSLWKRLKNNSNVDLFSRFKLLRKQTKI